MSKAWRTALALSLLLALAACGSVSDGIDELSGGDEPEEDVIELEGNWQYSAASVPCHDPSGALVPLARGSAKIHHNPALSNRLEMMVEIVPRQEGWYVLRGTFDVRGRARNVQNSRLDDQTRQNS
jgi:hypothetical protein